jgi:hypothetical protein
MPGKESLPFPCCASLPTLAAHAPVRKATYFESDSSTRKRSVSSMMKRVRVRNFLSLENSYLHKVVIYEVDHQRMKANNHTFEIVAICYVNILFGCFATCLVTASGRLQSIRRVC